MHALKVNGKRVQATLPNPSMGQSVSICAAVFGQYGSFVAGHVRIARREPEQKKAKAGTAVRIPLLECIPKMSTAIN